MFKLKMVTDCSSTRASGIVLIDEHWRVLLETADYRSHPFIPGGAAMAAEDPLQTAIRELNEELGVTDVELHLRLIDFTGRRAGENGVEHYWYSADVYAGSLVVRPDMVEVTGWSWYGVTDAIGLVATEYQGRLAAVLNAHRQHTMFVLW